MDIFTQGVGGRGMGGFQRITWFSISGKMERGIIRRRQSIKGGGGSNAHNKMGGRGIRISPPPPPHHGTKFTLSSCNICLGFAPERHS